MNSKIIFPGFLASTIPATAAMVSLSPTRDNLIFQDPNGALANGAGEFLFVGRNGGGGGNREMRSLLVFDLTDIPAGALIHSVTLNLTADFRRGRTVGVQTSVHRLTADWGEGSSQGIDGEGGGRIATGGDATWIHRFSADQMWTAAGGDFVDSPSATLDVRDSDITYSWTGQGLTADVQGVVDGDFENFGWILVGEQNGNGKRFNSGDRLTGLDLPELLIDYTPIPEPTGGILLSLAALGASLHRRRFTEKKSSSMMEELSLKEIRSDLSETTES